MEVLETLVQSDNKDLLEQEEAPDLGVIQANLVPVVLSVSQDLMLSQEVLEHLEWREMQETQDP